MIPSGKFKFYYVLILLSGFFFQLSSAQNNLDYAKTITIEELQEHMYFLASDFLEGRVAYEPGYEIAANYCASQFKLAGLTPFYKDDEGNLTYFQEVPLIKKTFGANCSISLIGSEGSTELYHIDDFKMPDGISDFSADELEIVFVGYGINEPDYNWNDFNNLDIKGKAVIFIQGTPSKNGKKVLPDDLDKEYHLVKGFQKKLFAVLKMNPAAVIVIPDNETIKMFQSWEMLPSSVGGDQYSYAEKITDDMFHIPPIFVLRNESVNKVFKNQKYSPEDIESIGMKGYKPFIFKDLKWKLNFEISGSEKIMTKNIVGLIEGSDEDLKNEYIVLCAHLDHIPPVNGQICNGADDNASGTVGLIEVAEAMKHIQTKRSVIFSIFTAEELGLIGSSHFLNHSPVPLENIKANINLDMIGRTSPENEETNAHNIILHKQYFESMKKLLSEVNSETLNFPLVYCDVSKSAGDSDHTSFNNVDIPNIHFYSGHHKDVHTPNDDAENIDYEKMHKVSQLVYYFTVKMANMDNLPF